MKHADLIISTFLEIPIFSERWIVAVGVDVLQPTVNKLM